MSSAARSLFAFGCYAVVAGIGLIVMPSVVLGVLFFPEPNDGWIRVVGVLALCVGLYHITAARHELVSYFQASVGVRILFSAALMALVATRTMPAPLLIFALADVAGASWTAVALRRDSALRASLSG
jgi:hypothetical protein